MYAEEGGDSGHAHTKICSQFLENGRNHTNFESYDGGLSPCQV